MTTVYEVPEKLLPFTWPTVSQFIQKVLDAEGKDAEFTIEELEEHVIRGYFKLIVYIEGTTLIGAMLMQYQDRPEGKVAFVYAVGGEDISSLDIWDQIKKIFKENGAVSSEAYMRPSRYRLWRRFGYETKYHVATVAL